MIIHVNNGKGYMYLVEADSTGDAIRRVNAEHPDFGGYYTDIYKPSGGGAVGKMFSKLGGPYLCTPESKGIRFWTREN